MKIPSTRTARETAVLAPPAIVLILLLHASTGYDAGRVELVRALLVVLCGHVLPGAVVWRLVRPERGWLIEDLGMGFGLGVALAVPGHVAAVAVGVPAALGVLLPIAVAVVALAVPAGRRRVLSRTTEPLPWLWGLATSLGALVPALNNWTAFVQPLRQRGWTVQYVDLPYHTALAHAVSERFPPTYPQLADERLTYHWFAHAWTAQVSAVSDTGVDVLLARFSPALLAVAVPLVTAVVAIRLIGRVWAGPAASAVAYLLLNVVPWGPAVLTNPLGSPMSPTQQFGMAVLLTLVAVLALRWRGEASRLGTPVLLLLLVVTGGSKGSMLPVVVAGVAAAALALLLLREWPRLRVVAVDAVVATGTLLVLNRLLFGGGDGGVSLDFGQDYVAERGSALFGGDVVLNSPTGVLALVVVTVPFLLGVLGALGLVRDRATRVDPTVWLLLGGGIAGLGAMVALTHPGESQGYFYKAGEPLLALAAVWGSLVLWERAGAGRRLLLTGLVVGPVAIGAARLLLPGSPPRGIGESLAALAVLLVLVAAGALVGARASGSGRPGAAAVAAIALLAAGLVPTVEQVVQWKVPTQPAASAETPSALHSRDVAALRWLGASSDRGDVVVTNKHCLGRVADPCDRRRFFIGAHSGRSVLIEGWTYNRRAAPLYQEHGTALFSDELFWDQDLLALNDGFIARPTAEAADRLWRLGVRWVVVWQDAPHADDLAPYADRVRRGLTLEVHRLRAPG